MSEETWKRYNFLCFSNSILHNVIKDKKNMNENGLAGYLRVSYALLGLATISIVSIYCK